MTRIFISHSHADQEIASLFVDFLLAALEIRPSDIRCTSVPGHQLPFGSSISKQLKEDLNKTTCLIALITKDSLRSSWVLFELGSSWATDRLVLPILGPGLTYKDLPGPLENYPAVPIEDENPSYRLTDVINQLASTLNIRQETNARRDAKLDGFISKFRSWKSQLIDQDVSQEPEIEHLTKQLEKSAQLHSKQLEEIKTVSQKEKQKLEQSYQAQIAAKELEINRLQSQIKQLHSYELETLPLHFIWICDCSGSMNIDGKIQSLNTAIKEALPEMRQVADKNTNANVLVRVVNFSDGAQWHVANPTPVNRFTWDNLTTYGLTDMGKALLLVAEQLKIPPMTDRALPPVLVLISDGQPTDDFNAGLNALLNEPWGKKAVKIAIAIGRDADKTVLKKFMDHIELQPIEANNPESLVRYIKWASTAVLQAASSPASQSRVAVPAVPAPSTSDDDDDVW